MADEMVRRAQRFVNSYDVSGIPKIAEDGITGYTTMYALTRCLQHELGITSLSDSFGPGTLSALQSRYPSVDASTSRANIVRVLQSGLYCKGYDGGGIDGTYNSQVAAGVGKLKNDAGVSGAYPAPGVPPKLFKAALTMDAFVLLPSGSAEARSVQQWLNGSYVGRRDFFIAPCDGFFSRDVQKNLLLGIQFQIGMSDDVANGRFGPGTQSGLRNNVQSQGSTGTWVRLFSGAMILNRRTGVVFTSVYDAALASKVREFQAFASLAVNGQGDFPTWASLLVSTGDTSRPGTACDCVTTVTPARASALHGAGYRVVGRYLSNAPGSSLNKRIQPGELAVVVQAGLRAFPIYQTNGGSASYFSHGQGVGDAFSALEWARHHGFRGGTRIYFAVDFDALDYQITDLVLPHFRGISETVSEYGREYEVGVYGPRNVCSRVRAAGHSSASFVSDMSTGYSGNLGYPLPEDWAFDQIATVSVGSGDGYIQIDKNVASGLDAGQNAFSPAPADSRLDVDFDMSQRAALLADVRAYLESIGVPESGGAGGDAFSVRTTAESFDVLMAFDRQVTSLARTLRMRKSLIACPLFWEVRKYNAQDGLSDDLVRSYHAGQPGRSDSSTGLGQIFAATSIRARNYCVAQQIIGGTTMDPTDDADLWTVWQKLNGDDIYNVNTVPLVLIEGAADIGGSRPGLNYTEAESEAVLARYNGLGDAAANYGRQLIGLYRVFEKYHAPLRG